MGILSAFSPIRNTNDTGLDGSEEEPANNGIDKDKENKIEGSPMVVSSLVPSSARKVFDASTPKNNKSNRASSVVSGVKGANVNKKMNTRSDTKKTNTINKLSNEIIERDAISETNALFGEEPNEPTTLVQDPSSSSLPLNDVSLLSTHIRTIVREELDEFKSLTLRDIRNLHIDMLKGNTLLERSVERILSKYLPTIGELLKELNDLRNENKRLRLRFNY